MAGGGGVAGGGGGGDDEAATVGAVAFVASAAAAAAAAAATAFGELLAANVDEGHFEAWDAVETPARVDDRLDEGEFFGAGGFEFLLVSKEEGLVLVGVVGREDDGAAGETGFDGVE